MNLNNVAELKLKLNKDLFQNTFLDFVYRLSFLSTGMERSSGQEVFRKKSVLRNFAKFTGKHLCQNLFFNKVVGLRPAALLKKEADTFAFQ